MKNLYTLSCILLIGFLISAQEVAAQYLPVVYNNTYGEGIQITETCILDESGQVVAIGKKNNNAICLWLDREGKVLLSKTFKPNTFSKINKVLPYNSNSVLLLGCAGTGKSKSGKGSGRAMLLTSSGAIEKDFYIGNTDTDITNGTVAKDGSFIFSGSKRNANQVREGYVCKINPDGTLIYEFSSNNGSSCDWFDVNEGSSAIIAVFNGEKTANGSSVVKLDKNGSPIFITPISDKSFRIEKCITALDGFITLAGYGEQSGGSVIKIRPEGDIVFMKQIVSPSAQTKLNQLRLISKGNILVGGNDERNAIFQVLRPDGTDLIKTIHSGVVSGIASNSSNGEVVVALYDDKKKRGQVIKLTNEGRKLYERNVSSKYSKIVINSNGDVLMGCPEEGRLSMISNFGEILFDRYIDEGNIYPYNDIQISRSGEIIFVDKKNRIAKLAHGIYIDDVVVNKPINGYTTAIFTVSLSGYSFSEEGAPIPVSVNYKTKELTANAQNNFTPVSGTLSFVPANDGSEKYMSKQIIEVPVKANDLLEGRRTFAIELDNVKYSYIIKKEGIATIEDQPGIIRMISSEDGIEGKKDVTYQLGIFKTNGERLINATGADVVIDGRYDEGTADELDFNMSKKPRLKITQSSHSGILNIETLEDTRYESEKTIILNFDNILAMSDTQISFPSSNLICEGRVFDQPAIIAISSLGDQSRLNNTVSNFFKISLLRAKDGALQTNNSGADIVITTNIDATSTAKNGVDFALVNAHDLRIWGDGKRSAVNLNGLVLFNPEAQQNKTLKINLKSVNKIPGAGPLSIAIDKKQSSLEIKGN